MAIDEGLDTGPVFRCEQIDIGDDETAAQLRARLSALAASMLVEALSSGLRTPVPQAGEPTYAAKIEPADVMLDWTRSAVELHRIVRIGRAWTTWRGRRLLVHAAQVEAGTTGPPGSLDGTAASTGEGSLRLLTVQPEGRAAMPAIDWLRGTRPRPGELLGS
jgi:methionyl-tRNA formyltransferase